ncbi:lysis system i-spanin subunit Rz [Xanthomonas translucens]|uniref:lysis system i-spanin subunit Rz n=1 Tax=Xanthomonas campestris pv. translucens TaxID=343 RepID=UPI00071E86D2|nr:lysis system i-spanin subunit Rz [Xanthomonas translucens]WLA02798.1 lysis system i-spanin subunit Rz [Xanthomonas translucens]
MNRILIAIAAALLWSAAMFGAGWAWRGDRAEAATAHVDTAAAQGEAKAQAGAREIEHTQGQVLADIGAKHEEDRTAAQAVPAAVVAGVRDGSLQLRDDLATCETQRLSDAAAGAAERDAPAQLRAEVAGDLVRLARDADDQLEAAQAVIVADRAGSAAASAAGASGQQPK